MRYIIFIYFLGLLSSSHVVLAQKQLPDSIQLLIKNSPRDTNLVKTLQANIRAFQASYPEIALKIAELSLQIAQENQWKLGMGRANVAIGRTHRIRGDYAKALEAYLEAEKILLTLEPSDELIEVWNNIGVIYRILADYDKALKYHEQALKSARESKNHYIEAYALNSLGDVYKALKKFDKALNYHQEALKVSTENDNLQGMAPSTNNVGIVYFEMKNYAEAEKYLLQAKILYEKIPSELGVAICLIELAKVEEATQDFEKGIVYAEQALRLVQKVGSKERIYDALEILTRLYGDVQNYEKAYFYQSLFLQYKDSLLANDESLEIGRLESKFEIYKKAQENTLLKKENDFHQQTIFWQWLAMGSGTIFAIILAINLRYINQKNQKIRTQRNQLTEKNNELEKTLHELNLKNKKIIDSLLYAKRMQQALLPPAEEVQRVFGEHFIFFSPKDLVSGDFYWLGISNPRPIFQEIPTEGRIEKVFKTFESEKQIFSVIDCTGHGVPGGLMSMIANDLLNQIVLEEGITEPDLILTEIHQKLKQLNRQNTHGIKEGMDLSICTIDTEKQQMALAGAFSQMIYFKDGQMHLLKGNKISIGGFEIEKEFTKTILPLDSTITLYLFTDGYQDQFGGHEKRKFSPRRLRDVLQNIYQKPMREQADIIENTFLEWKQNEEQTDDILITGMRIFPPTQLIA